MAPAPPPVIAIDGPSASGKGTVAQQVAQALGFHYLDSGALYRVVALAAVKASAKLDGALEVAAIARNMKVIFSDGAIRLEGRDVTDEIRHEAVSDAASRVAALPEVRRALLQVQQARNGDVQMPPLAAVNATRRFGIIEKGLECLQHASRIAGRGSRVVTAPFQSRPASH